MSKNEFKFRKEEIVLTGLDVENMIESKDVWTKFVNKCIHKIQADLGNLVYVGREAEATIEINTLREFIKSIEKTTTSYRSYIQKLEDEKEAKEKEIERIKEIVKQKEQT